MMWPETPKAVVRLLRRLGCEVEFPVEQTCCGQMFTNTGYADEALPAVRNFTATFSGYDAVVAPSGSCVGSIRHQHRDIAARAGDRQLEDDVVALSPRVYELSEFLVDVLGVTDVGAHFPHRVTYHPTCHSLRMLRVGDRPLQLLKAVRGIDLVELAGCRAVLRIRRYVRDEERRHLGRDGFRQSQGGTRDRGGNPCCRR